MKREVLSLRQSYSINYAAAVKQEDYARKQLEEVDRLMQTPELREVLKMKREITLRIAPASPALEGKILNLIKADYRVEDIIRQRLDGESYLYLKLESKDAHP
jgi:hypothetical protein